MGANVVISAGLLWVAVAFTGCETVQQAGALLDGLGAEPTSAEVALGLKEALDVGIQRGADALAENGYRGTPYAIQLPPEAQTIIDNLRFIPGMDEAEALVKARLNEAATDAADKAAPIFAGAIQRMTIADARAILLGGDGAATSYFKRATFDELYAVYRPVVESSLNEVGAQTYWRDLIDRYNRIPLVKPANADLADFVTREALNGLFAKLADEENLIREDPATRTSMLLRRVFALQDK